jgi:hypothetical protein
MEVKVARLDLATRGIDLTTALLQATASSGSLLKGAWEIGQWLGRERLNQYELLDCMQKAKGIVFANKQGQQFFDQIIRGLDTVPVKPLFLQQSGSLGRLMAGDPNLSWIVSTVACLFQHERDEQLVTETLTTFIIKSHQSPSQEQGSHLDGFSSYSPEKTRLRVVVRKIVSSVWYNVINVGCDTIPLPQELVSVCPRGHYLDPEDFAIVINTIHGRCQTKAILKTSHLLRDVSLWLLLHYDGTIVFNVGGQIVYRVDLGNPHRELEVHVESPCPEDGDCGSVGKEPFKILHNIHGKFELFLSGYSISGFSDLPPQPGIRQKVYEIPRLYPRDSKMWNKGLQILVKCSAQSIMQWLLGVPLSAQQTFSPPGFSAEPGKQAVEGRTTVSLVLKRIPAMINSQWGSSPASQVVFGGDQQPQDGLSPNGNIRSMLKSLTVYFPILNDLAEKVSRDCLCLDCSERDKKSLACQIYALKPGCLGRAALDEVLLLLAHGVADGFGVSNASSTSDTSHIVEGMALLLFELTRGMVCWDTWFAVASCVYLGCPFVKPVSGENVVFGGTAFAAIQYGNLAAQAPWLDLTQDHTVEGCFGLIGSRGRLGVLTKSDDQSAQFRSVEENFAIIETENTEDTISLCSRYKKAASAIDHLHHMDEDDSLIDSDVILYQVDDKFYRLLLRIKTSTHWRVVDPSDAFSAIIRMLPSVTCPHGTQPPEIPPLNAKIYTMEEVLGRWPDVVQSPESGPILHVANILGSHLKKNIALALSVCTIAVPNYPQLACSTCALNHAVKAERKPLRESEGGSVKDRYIINLKTRLAEQGWPDGTASRRGIAAS